MLTRYKRWATVVLLSCLLTTTAWAASRDNLENRLKTLVLPVAVQYQGQPLQQVLDFLETHTGIHFIAVPEAADMPVDLTAAAGETLEQVLDKLNAQYRLEIKVNQQHNAVVVFAGQYNERMRKALNNGLYMAEMAPAPGMVSRQSMAGAVIK